MILLQKLFTIVTILTMLPLPARRPAQAAPASVTTMRAPNGGIQPQVAVDGRGVVHLIYFKGDPAHGDLFYVRSSDGGRTFSTPIRVNSQPGSAIAVGTIRGAQIALGRNGRVHVAWNGSDAARPRLPSDPAVPGSIYNSPMLYTRLKDDGSGFEPQRNLMHFTYALDGGGSVAADNLGNVYVVWHAQAGAKDEAGRAVFVAVSQNEGKSFAREKRANPSPTGACGCCGLRAYADNQGVLSILYRAAGSNIHRDTMLLVSRDKGETYEERLIDRWQIDACPMSSFALSETKNGILAAWETREHVYFTIINPADLTISRPVAVPGSSQKHPVILADANGQILFAWTEGTGWQRGGSVAWQVYDPSSAPTMAPGKADGVPVWSLATAYARPDGSFVVIY